MKQIAIVGCGAAGLAALRHFTAVPELFSVTAFELSSEIGGTWVYTDKTKLDEYGLPIHSSMYRNLVTNLSHEVMQFPDFPFTDMPKSFVTHQQVLRYLNQYADHYELRRFIKFNTLVKHITPTDENNRFTQWKVSTQDLGTKVESTENYHAVLLCNGHYSVPRIPPIDGIENFRGEISHSHEYRFPEPFKGKRVAILGAHASGVDIAVDISPFAKEIMLSHNQPQKIAAKLPPIVCQFSGVERFTTDGAIQFKGSDELHYADAFIFCTGYNFHFPFLDPKCKFQLDSEINRMPTLWKHLIHADYPTLSVVGVCTKIAPFPHFHVQVQFVKNLLLDESKVPSKSAMLADIAADLHWRQTELHLPKHYAHQMHDLQWPYMKELADYAGFENLPPYVEKLYKGRFEWPVCKFCRLQCNL